MEKYLITNGLMNEEIKYHNGWLVTTFDSMSNKAISWKHIANPKQYVKDMLEIGYTLINTVNA